MHFSFFSLNEEPVVKFEHDLSPSYLHDLLDNIADFSNEKNLKKDFYNCPRCHGDFREEIKLYSGGKEVFCFCYCDVCPMKYDVKYSFIALRNPICEEVHLTWDINFNKCSYGSLSDYVSNKEKILPWLPYNISSERLKLLLAFS